VRGGQLRLDLAQGEQLTAERARRDGSSGIEEVQRGTGDPQCI
jgi:hypothetical protein